MSPGTIESRPLPAGRQKWISTPLSGGTREVYHEYHLPTGGMFMATASSVPEVLRKRALWWARTQACEQSSLAAQAQLQADTTQTTPNS